MLHIQSIEVPIYRGRFAVMFTDKEEKLETYFDDLSYGYKVEYAHTFLINEIIGEEKRQVYLIAFNTNCEARKITRGVIAHEVFHAASSLLRDARAELNEGSEEAFSYLIEWMTDYVYSVIDKNDIKVDNTEIPKPEKII